MGQAGLQDSTGFKFAKLGPSGWNALAKGFALGAFLRPLVARISATSSKNAYIESNIVGF